MEQMTIKNMDISAESNPLEAYRLKIFENR